MANPGAGLKPSTVRITVQNERFTRRVASLDTPWFAVPMQMLKSWTHKNTDLFASFCFLR